MLKTQKKENFNEENDKIGLIIRKNQGIVNKAEEIKEKIEENLIKESQKMNFLRKKNHDLFFLDIMKNITNEILLKL